MDELRAYMQKANFTVGAHFIENHDEDRAAAKFGSYERANAAAVITFLLPGLKFYF